MCRHYSLKQKDKYHFQDLDGFEEVLSCSEQVVPGESGMVLIKAAGKWTLKRMTFGLHIHNKYIYNARSETVLEKPLFADAFKQNRCIIPCSFFQEEDKYRNEHSFFDPEEKILYLAGIYQDNGFVILTEKPTPEVAFYHPRMPLCLEKSDIPIYLNLNHGTELFSKLKKPDLVSPDSSVQLALF